MVVATFEKLVGVNIARLYDVVPIIVFNSNVMLSVIFKLDCVHHELTQLTKKIHDDQHKPDRVTL